MGARFFGECFYRPDFQLWCREFYGPMTSAEMSGYIEAGRGPV